LVLRPLWIIDTFLEIEDQEESTHDSETGIPVHQSQQQTKSSEKSNHISEHQIARVISEDRLAPNLKVLS
jgi:hypothetical protein